MSSAVTSLSQLEAELSQCLFADERALQPRLRGLRRRQRAGKPIDRGLEALGRGVEEARARAARRWERRPRELNYPADLPVVAARERIAAAVREHQVVVVAGETGSGKTTQLPKICLELGRGARGLIGHTQPRRLAARTVAARIAAELGGEPGGSIGYQVRFTEQVGPDSLVKLMTDGILLAEIQRDPLLTRYDTLIIDEAHERSLNIDFLLGYLHRLLPRRPDLKLVITSATLDVERFSHHFGQAPVIEVSGRTFPVEVRYRPARELAPEGDLSAACCAALEEIIDSDRGRGGDVLVFLPGEREIRELARELRRRVLPGLDILPLYARLSLAEQNRVFDTRQRRGRRVVLATNVAETSLTVPGIHYVVDTGLARISRYSVRSKLQRLPVEPISRASADQRAGRCGRIGPGICYRLYDEEEFAQRPAFTDPEIHRTNLAAVILQMLNLGLGEIESFPFIDPPQPRQIGDGFKLLEELDAVDSQRGLTERGQVLAKLPVDPRLARMLVEAQARGALAPVLVIASALSVQDPRERPPDKQQAADACHGRFDHPESDFLSAVALWDYVEAQRQDLSSSQFRKLCEREYLSWLRLREWRDVHRQLQLLCRELGWRHPAIDSGAGIGAQADYEAVHRSLLAGLLSHIARREERREYIAARNRRVHLFPGSTLYRRPPAWLVAADIVETSQVYARNCGRIDPEWVFGLNDRLLKRSYGDPYWNARNGRVMARETVTLFGLVIRDGRRVHYGPIDPVAAREQLIQGALVEGRMSGEAPFQVHNRALIEEIEALEDKGRRRDILADQRDLYAFFDERVPPGITTLKELQRWRREVEVEQPRILYVPRERLMRPGAEAVDTAQFPDQWQHGDVSFALEYRFEPGHPEDGVTLVVPLALLNRVPENRLDYLVPGLLRDKCIALLKTLPKTWRRQFVPAPDAVDAVLPRLQPGEVPLTEALGAALFATRGVEVPADAWRPEQLDDFYRMHVRVLGENGETLARGRDPGRLKEQLQDQMQAALHQHGESEFAAQTLQRWDFGALPEQVEIDQNGARAVAYPALVARDGTVAVTLLESAERARLETADGVVQLLMRETADTLKYLRKELLRGNALHLQLAGVGQRREDWLEDLLVVVYRQVFLAGGDLPRDEGAFRRLLEAGRGRLVADAQSLAQLLLDIGRAYEEVRQRRRGGGELAWLHALEDIQQQLDKLLQPGFIRATPLEQLQRYPVYLRAIAQRLDKLRGHYQRDRELTNELNRLQQRFWQLLQRRPDLAERAETRHYRWLLEELRVSLFAQQLGTAAPVSVKRLDQQWQRVEEERRGTRG